MTATEVLPSPPDIDDGDEEIGHSVCTVCWPNAETEPHRATCGAELPPGPILDEPPPGTLICVVCIDVILGGYGCGHN